MRCTSRDLSFCRDIDGANTKGLRSGNRIAEPHVPKDVRKPGSIRKFGDGFGQVAICPVVFGKHPADKGCDVVEIKMVKLLYRKTLGFRKLEDDRLAARLEHPV